MGRLSGGFALLGRFGRTRLFSSDVEQLGRTSLLHLCRDPHGWLTYHTWFENCGQSGDRMGRPCRGTDPPLFSEDVSGCGVAAWGRGVGSAEEISGPGVPLLLWVLRIPLGMLSPLGRWLQPVGAHLTRRLEPIVRPVAQLSRTIRRWLSGKGKNDE